MSSPLDDSGARGRFRGRSARGRRAERLPRGAGERIRTSTGFPPMRPERIASAVPPHPRGWFKTLASGLETNVLMHPGNAPAAIDADVPTASAITAADAIVRDAHEVTGEPEQVDDVLRHIREVVAQVLVDASSVHKGAAIRADAAAQESPRGFFDQIQLPRLELDRSLVLKARAVLGKKAR
jgi:hypothetical protein